MLPIFADRNELFSSDFTLVAVTDNYQTWPRGSSAFPRIRKSFSFGNWSDRRVKITGTLCHCTNLPLCDDYAVSVFYLTSKCFCIWSAACNLTECNKERHLVKSSTFNWQLSFVDEKMKENEGNDRRRTTRGCKLTFRDTDPPVSRGSRRMRNVLACTPIRKAVRSEAYAILDWRAKRRSGISPSVRASIEEKASVGGDTTTPFYPQENTKVQTTRNVFNQSFYFSFSFSFIKKILFVTSKTSRDYINMSYMILILFLILFLPFSFFFFFFFEEEIEKFARTNF